MIVCVAIHVLMSIKVGGVPLLVSMFLLQVRAGDTPSNWLRDLRDWWGNFGIGNNLVLRVVEVIVLVGIVAAFILPLFAGGGE
jgi:hypothetical protein